jgi:hypothetical protein
MKARRSKYFKYAIGEIILKGWNLIAQISTPIIKIKELKQLKL